MSSSVPPILRSLACLPLAATALAAPAPASIENNQAHPPLPAPAWSFFHENILGTSMQLTLRTAGIALNPAASLNSAGLNSAGLIPTGLAEASRAEAAVLASIDRDTQILSAWRKDSELSRWLATREQAVRVSPQLIEVLALFDRWRALTFGALNPAAEAAARLWLAAATELRQPTLAELAHTIAAIAQPHWQLDPANQTATHLTDLPLTLASFTKGYIADRAADAALTSGATGIMLNLGGDIVLRGDLAQPVAIANPRAHSENDAPIDRIVLRDRAIATSGSYRRTLIHATPLSSRPKATPLSPQRRDLRLDTSQLSHSPSQVPASHIIDPRTAAPTGHILSSTVIAPDPITAGALATAFSVLTPGESQALARILPGVDYLLVTRSGERIASDGWRAYQAPPSPTLRLASYSAPQSNKPAAASNSAPQNFELAINLEIGQPNDFRYRRPFVAVWVENEDHYPVRTIALWYSRDRWLPDLRSWYRDDQLRFRMEGGSVADTVSSATRAPGKYSLKWDGKDNHGNPVKAGKYTVFIEAAREHGGYDLLHQQIDLNGQPQQHTFAPGNELGAVTLDYRKQ